MSDTEDVYFGTKWAPLFIIGTSIFSVCWGLLNAFLVRSINMDDHTAIDELMKDSKSINNQQPLLDDDGEEINT